MSVNSEVSMRANPDESDSDGRPGYTEAREELNVLERLSQRIWAAISDYGKRPKFDRHTGEVELGIHDWGFACANFVW
jgi:hypothetical protein